MSKPTHCISRKLPSPQLKNCIIREVLVKGNSVSLRLSASNDNLIKETVEESHFALALKSAVFDQIGRFWLREIPYLRGYQLVLIA